MQAEDWRRLRAHFEALCEKSPTDQARLLEELDEPEELIARLRRMLAADTGDALGEHVAEQAPALHRLAGSAAVGSDADARIGQRLGAWRVLASAGSGGMGHVYRARRDDGRYDAEAAIKVVARGIDAGRFRRERSVLARLEHPGIARLLDAGECEDGRPYLVMEFVDGTPIDRHASAHRLRPNQCVELVVQAARAVAYAHARAVLHRDLKPDNILVDAAGRVKLLDFGVAKLLDEDDADGNETVGRFFTPHYAAPEQMAGEPVTTATDVFALAVVLFELVAGRHPFLHKPDDAQLSRRVLTGEPLPLRRALRAAAEPVSMDGTGLRDLEAVLDRALQRDPARRYQAMDAFANELERVVEGAPVRARTIGAPERLWRWSRRHRVAALALTLGALGLASGLGLALWQAQEARLQRDAAVLEAERARRIADFLAGVFSEPNPVRARAVDMSARDLLDRSRERISGELADDPATRVELQRVIADTYRSLSMYDEAEALLTEALSADTGPRAALLSDLGWVHAYQGRFGDSEARLREAFAQAEAENDAVVRINAQTRLANALINLGRLDDAEASATRALELLQLQAKPNRMHMIAVKDLLATVAYNRRDLDRAEVMYRESIRLREAAEGPERAGIGLALNNLAAVTYMRGDFLAAERAYRQAVEVQRSHYGVDNTLVALPLRGVALALRKQGRGAEALELMREAATMFSTWEGAAHPNALLATMDALELALLLGEDGSAEAERLSGVEESMPVDSPNACRYQLLTLLGQGAPSPERLRAACDCLDRGNARSAIRAHAWVSLLEAQRREGAVDAATVDRARTLLEELTPGDIYLQQRFAAAAI